MSILRNKKQFAIGIAAVLVCGMFLLLPSPIQPAPMPFPTPAPLPPQSQVVEEDSASYPIAYEFGVSTGEFFNDSRDAVADFWHGFDDTTGASDWAREHWENGRDRFEAWQERQEAE